MPTSIWHPVVIETTPGAWPSVPQHDAYLTRRKGLWNVKEDVQLNEADAWSYLDPQTGTITDVVSRATATERRWSVQPPGDDTIIVIRSVDTLDTVRGASYQHVPGGITAWARLSDVLAACDASPSLGPTRSTVVVRHVPVTAEDLCDPTPKRLHGALVVEQFKFRTVEEVNAILAARAATMGATVPKVTGVKYVTAAQLHNVMFPDADFERLPAVQQSLWVWRTHRLNALLAEAGR